MSITERGSAHGGSGSGTATTVSPALTGWTAANPQPGDLVIVCGFVMAAGGSWSQTAGTGMWSVHSSDSNSAGVSGLTSFVATRVFDGSETAPTFTVSGVSAARTEWYIAGLVPDSGADLKIDVWATTAVVTTAAMSFTANPATCSGSGECSVIAHCYEAAATGSALITPAAESGWGGFNGGNAAQAGDSTHPSGAISLTHKFSASGTVTPGAATTAVSSVATLYHVLAAEVFAPVQPPPPPRPPRWVTRRRPAPAPVPATPPPPPQPARAPALAARCVRAMRRARLVQVPPPQAPPPVVYGTAVAGADTVATPRAGQASVPHAQAGAASAPHAVSPPPGTP